MNITKAGLEDLPAILELQKVCYRENAERVNDKTIQPLTQTLEEIEDEFTKYTFLKVLIDEKIVGSVRAYEKDNTCYIGKVIVHPDYQNKGLGKHLMAEIENHFNNVSRYELFTGSKDEKNLYFYQKLGYHIFREEKINENVTLIFLEK